MKHQKTADPMEPVAEEVSPPPIQPREPVSWFATIMETKLRQNDHKGGWQGGECDYDYIEGRIREELAELGKVLMQYQIAALSPAEHVRTRYLGEKVQREAADVANFVMMIADKVRAELRELSGAEPKESERAT